MQMTYEDGLLSWGKYFVMLQNTAWNQAGTIAKEREGLQVIDGDIISLNSTERNSGAMLMLYSSYPVEDRINKIIMHNLSSEQRLLLKTKYTNTKRTGKSLGLKMVAQKACNNGMCLSLWSVRKSLAEAKSIITSEIRFN